MRHALAYDPMAVADEAEIANKLFLTALRTRRGPDGLLWGNQYAGVTGQADGWRLAKLSFARAAEIEASKVTRDACSFCGVRADHGCKHNTI